MDAELPALSDVGKSVLAALLTAGEATRRDLAHAARVSFPTVTAALGELGKQGLVEEIRREQGARGRATIVYGVGGEAGWVLGADIGSTQVSLMVRDLGGSILERKSAHHNGDALSASALAARLAGAIIDSTTQRGPLRAIALGVNQVVPGRLSPGAGRHGITHAIVDHFVTQLGRVQIAPLLVENNVNCAAVAEHYDGHLRGFDDAAYMQIGVGLGLGFFCGGALIRGGHGAGGELAQVPISWSATTQSPHDAIEQALGAGGLLRRVREAWTDENTKPETLDAVFAFEAARHPELTGLLRDHAIALARLAAAAATILDPEKLVFGGGLTQSQGFMRMIMDEFASRNSVTQIALSEKRSEATVEGATILARDLALCRLLDRHHRALLAKPAIW